MSRKTILYHALAWVIFMTYEISTLYFVAGRLAPATDFIPHYLLNILVFYVHVSVVSGGRPRYQKILLAIFVAIAYLFINYGLNTFLENYVVRITRPVNPLKSFLVASLYRCLYFMGLGTLYGIALNLLRSKDQVSNLLAERLQKENIRIGLEKDLLISRNALLRAQINPHLFFNTLNFIYNSVHRLSAVAGEAVMLLADITRYSITKADSDGLVYLRDELTNIADLISLNQIRFNSGLQIRFEIGEVPEDLKIVPLVLLTLVENVIKYGDLQDPVHPAVIRIQMADDYLHFATRNKKVNDLQRYKGTGIGLPNTRIRLQQAYPDRFNLRINETEETYFVDLTIHPDCLCLAAIS